MATLALVETKPYFSHTQAQSHTNAHDTPVTLYVQSQPKNEYHLTNGRFRRGTGAVTASSASVSRQEVSTTSDSALATGHGSCDGDMIGAGPSNCVHAICHWAGMHGMLDSGTAHTLNARVSP